MKKSILLFCAILLVAQIMTSQIKVRTNGSLWQGYSGYANIYMGTSPGSPPYQNYDNGKWGIEVWGENFNIWKPWPSLNNGEGNYYMFLTPAGGVGIGKVPTQSGICLDVNGKVYSYGIELTSDERLKKDIKPLAEQLEKLYQLNGKSYKKQAVEGEIVLPDITDEMGNVLKKYEKSTGRKYQEITEFGFLAQELKEIYPELVSQDTLGYYYVNYIGLIPVLVESVKSLKAEIDALKETGSSMQKAAQSPTSLLLNETETSILYQNNPNPFSQTTLIKYYLPKTVTAAYLCVYDLQGKQLKQYTLTERGESSKIISASEFPAGIYLYGLISDGKEVDVKRMVLTE
ncbi:MAG: tail fiber domain-containing protein [Paludibacter sp.]|nr:tail fiber domain-containing protein [Paludibacter sp.]